MYPLKTPFSTVSPSTTVFIYSWRLTPKLVGLMNSLHGACVHMSYQELNLFAIAIISLFTVGTGKCFELVIE